MVYNIESHKENDSRLAIQFFITLLPDEKKLLIESKIEEFTTTYQDFTNSVRKRIAKILLGNYTSFKNHQISGSIKEENIMIHQVCDDSKEWIVVAFFDKVDDIDETGQNQNSVFTQILHGKGYADFSLQPCYPITWHESKGHWQMWRYDNTIPPSKNYVPFITPTDYKEFETYDDDLMRCLVTFKRELPIFLRARWSNEYEHDIVKIENCQSYVDTFNKVINYPSTKGEEIIDNLFSTMDETTMNLLSNDSYAVFGYFYGIHLN